MDKPTHDVLRERDLAYRGVEADVTAGPGGRLLVSIRPEDLDRLILSKPERKW